MEPEKIVQKAMKVNPEIQLVLDIATRARETEALELPRELGATTDVVALPNNPQSAV
jgi:hypothetical protein